MASPDAAKWIVPSLSRLPVRGGQSGQQRSHREKPDVCGQFHGKPDGSMRQPALALKAENLKLET